LGEKGKREKAKREMTEKRKKIERFEDLLVWQKGMEIVKQVYLSVKRVSYAGILPCGTSCAGRLSRFPPTSPKGLSALPARNTSVS
jgi:hypothetical protein